MSDLLPKEPWQYQLFQALRLLESRLLGGPRLGELGPAEAEQIRLRPSTSLGFPAGEVVEISTRLRPDGELTALVTTNLPGLYGVGSPLPRSYPHRILLEDDEQPQQRDFLDLIHHRLQSLWYRSWRQYHYEQSYEPGGQDLMSRALFDWLGIPAGADVEDLGIEPMRLLHYLGLLCQRARPVKGLEIIIHDELGIPVGIEQLPSRWITLGSHQWSRVSSNRRQRGALGRDIVIGARRLDRMGGLNLHIGPVDYQMLLSLWPGGSLLRRLTALCRFYLRLPLDLCLRVQVPRREVPPARLGGASSSRLGAPCAVGGPKQDPVVFLIKTSLAAGGATSAAAAAANQTEGDPHVSR